MTGGLILLIAYLVGGVPFGFLLVRWKTGRDVRTLGSGNIGATNVLRTTGRALAFITLALDVAKGAFAVWLAGLLSGGSPVWMSAAAIAVMLGHAFPVFLKFHGGKAVASFVGAFGYLTPLPLVIVLLLFVAVVWRTRYISLGSIAGAATFPFVAFAVSHPPLPVLAAAVAGAAFIIWRHRENIGRLRAGNENVLQLGGRRS